MEHVETRIKTIFGNSTLHCFSYGTHEENNFLVIEAGNYKKSKIVRVQSACYTAEIFRSTDCDCHEQLTESLKKIHSDGGLLIYMLCDGRGAGLLTKIKGLDLGIKKGLDTYKAYAALGVEKDPRQYKEIVEILNFFEMKEVHLLTNNPRKVSGVEQGGIKVIRKSLEIPPTKDSYDYLATKKRDGGHWLEELKIEDDER